MREGLTAQVIVTQKSFIPVLQGSTTLHDLHAHHFTEVSEVVMGKLLFVTLDTVSVRDAEKSVRKMCEQLLGNPVIEDCRFSLRLTEQSYDHVAFDDALMRLTVRERDKLTDRIEEIGRELHAYCPKRRGESYASTLRVDVKEWLYECTLCGAAGDMVGIIHRLTFPEWSRDQIRYWLADVAIWLKPHLLLFRYPCLEERYTMKELLEKTSYANSLRAQERNKRELTKSLLAAAKAKG